MPALISIFIILSTSIANAQTQPHCRPQIAHLPIQMAMADKRIVFIGESHTRSPKPITEENIIDQVCALKRPVIILTEFLWPSWQPAINRFLSDSKTPALKGAQEFINRYVGPSNLSVDIYRERLTDFLVWAKQSKIQIIGIDNDNRDEDGPDAEFLNLNPKLVLSVAQSLNIHTHMIDEVSGRDMQMSNRILKLHKRIDPRALILVYAGSRHTEKIPTLLSPYISIKQMISFHMNLESRNDVSIETKLAASPFNPETWYFAPYPDLTETLKYAEATQQLIYKSRAFGLSDY